MKLIPEQILYLRKRKQELENKMEEYRKYCQNRESAGFDSFGGPHFVDYQEQLSMSHTGRELNEITKALSTAEFITDRSFEMIDIGTGFMVKFGEDDPERALLIDEGTTFSGQDIYASTGSDFGKAVLGHKAGDKVDYTVTATGRKVSISIEEIDKIKEHYAHFIKEKAYTDRVSNPAKKELARLKVENEEEYKNRFAITPSQKRLLLEELGKISSKSKDASVLSRKGHIAKILKDSKVAALPTGDTIQVGSIVEVMLKEEGKEPVTMNFEFINRAVSTEIEGEYVERISTLGQAIDGLQKGSTFTVRRSQMPSLKGIVMNVENYNEKERVR